MTLVEGNVLPPPRWSHQTWGQWGFQDPLIWRYVSTIFLAIFCGDIPWNLGLIWALYMVGTSNLGSWNGHQTGECHTRLQPYSGCSRYEIFTYIWDFFGVLTIIKTIIELYQPWLPPLVNVYITILKDPPFLMGKSTISMAIFNSYVKLPEGTLDEINSVSRKALKSVSSYQVA